MEYRYAVFATPECTHRHDESDLQEVPHIVVVDRGMTESENVRVIAVDDVAAVELVNTMNDQAYASLTRVH